MIIKKTKRHSILEGLRNRKPFRKEIRKTCKGKDCEKKLTKEEEEVEFDDDELLLTGDDVEGEFDDEMLLGESKTERDFTRLVESFMDDTLDEEDTEDKLDDDDEESEDLNEKNMPKLRKLRNMRKFGESRRPRGRVLKEEFVDIKIDDIEDTGIVKDYMDGSQVSVYRVKLSDGNGKTFERIMSGKDEKEVERKAEDLIARLKERGQSYEEVFGESYRPLRQPHRRLAESHKRPIRFKRPERMTVEHREVRKPVLKEHRLHRKLRSPFHK